MDAALNGNPLLEEFRRWQRDCDHRIREAAISRYSFAIPTGDALATVARHAPDGVVEVGAGTGYWARLLADRGVDVVAFDIAPPPSQDNDFFAGADSFFDVQAGDHVVVEHHADRTLLLVWPTPEEWGAHALQRFADAGGRRVVFVGEGAGGRTGDEQLHAMLGFTDGCVACEYGVANAPCVCGVRREWACIESVPLPHWGGYLDDLYVFARHQR